MSEDLPGRRAFEDDTPGGAPVLELHIQVGAVAKPTDLHDNVSDPSLKSSLSHVLPERAGQSSLPYP